jgi:Biotin-requiring enzyme/e3 binding domain
LRIAFQTQSRVLAAQNFTMPALSPTMTEGNISSWKLKEGSYYEGDTGAPATLSIAPLCYRANESAVPGDSFSAGDIILEIETDKAQMDVEAQDDGILAKITQGDGSKGVQVGSRIGVLAEPDDDLSTLEIPPEDSAPEQEAKKEKAKPSKSESSKPAAPASDSQKSASSESQKTAKSSKQGGKAGKQGTLLPSVVMLLHQNNVPVSEADKIPASGPKGRLLKGDILAYLNKVDKAWPEQLEKSIEKREHLDLSNIKILSQKKDSQAVAEKAGRAQPVPEVPQETVIQLPISFAEVEKVQHRVNKTLGTFLPISTFVARATEIANDDLPLSKNRKPSADELFNEVLGLSKVATVSRGNFIPQVAALPQASLQRKPDFKSGVRSSDIVDILSGAKSAPKKAKTSNLESVVGEYGLNVFSVTVPKGDEKRAMVFLEKLKLYLEAEPGRLVL